MVNLFRKNELTTPGNYKYTFYPDEFQQPGGKSQKLLHLHVVSHSGEIRVYLLDELRIENKRGNIPSNQQTKIKKFIQENRQFIMLKIEKELNRLKIELK